MHVLHASNRLLHVGAGPIKHHLLQLLQLLLPAINHQLLTVDTIA